MTIFIIFYSKRCLNKKKIMHTFTGNQFDKRGYSSVDDFSKLLLSFSKKNESFIKDYGNKNLVTIQEIINLFNQYYFKKNKKFFIANFSNKKKNVSYIKLKKNSVYSSKKSIIVIKKYLTKSLNEKNL